MRKTGKHMLALSLALVMAVAAQFAMGAQNPSHRTLSLSGDDIWLEGDGPSASSNTATFTTSEVNPYKTLSQAIKNFSATNPDVRGWLMIPGTNINFPITYSNQNNGYYLYRDWKGTNYPSITWKNWYNYPDSATYVDYRHKFGDTWETSSRNTVLYGHNWSNLRAPFQIGSNEANDRTHKMFGQLPSYTSIDFAKWQPHIYYSTDKNEGIWRVFAVGYCEVTPNFFYNNSNPTKAQLQEIITEWKQRSMFNFGVDVNSEDKILTLTTCTRQYGASEHQRFVVVARLLRPGESEKDTVTVAVNPNVKHPDFTQPVTLAQLKAQQAAQAALAQPSAPETAPETPATSSSPSYLSDDYELDTDYGPSFFDSMR